MKFRKLFSLLLALALQVMPLTRLFVVATPATGSSFAIIAMWLGGAAALLGSVDAVSGASSISISPATATVGVPYSGVVQYSGVRAASIKSWSQAQNWNGSQAGCNSSYEIAPGLWVTNSSTYLMRIGGTPTASGTFNFALTIHDAINCGGIYTDTRSAAITINPAPTAAPGITTQPVSQTVAEGANVSFSVSAGGTAPLHYQWRQNGTNLAGANAYSLTLTSVTVGKAGSYAVVVTNNAGAVTSHVATLTVNPVLALVIIGNGSVTGATNAQAIPLGRVLKLKAIPAAGNIFSNWVGTVAGTLVYLSNAPALTVPMASQLAITANFVPNPFPAVSGQFNGLFFETNGANVGTCGFFSLKVGTLGTYTGTILNDGRRASVSGRFDAGGKALNTVQRAGTNALIVVWSLDLTGSDQITGTIGNGSWIAGLSGDRAVFNTLTNPCSHVGKYTFVLPGTPGATLTPEGNSYGTVTIGSDGVATLKGFLADKTSIAQTVPVSKNGEWPLYLPRPSRKGVLIAWINLTNRPTDDFSGQGVWLMPPLAIAAYYPGGFAYAQTLVGSRYTPPAVAGGNVLSLSNALAFLSGGDLAGAYTNGVVLGPGSQITASPSNALTAVFTPASGLFKGKFSPGTSQAAVALSGVAFQKTTNAFGCFYGKNQSGQFLLQAGSLP